MEQRAEDYYAALSGEYSKTIRQLVPMYDDMVACILRLVELAAPKMILDLGSGVGELEQVLLRTMPVVRITAVDACEAMVGEARRCLRSVEDRVTIVHQDILQYASAVEFDVVVSNLVIHNIPPNEKRRLLQSVARWTAPGGSFLWGDFVRHADSEIHDHFVQERRAFALESGCPRELVDENFAKEGEVDFPLTIDETRRMVKMTGFRDPQIVWLHDTFAVFSLTT
jgi:SAM-dependent methyltransferase